MVDEIVVLAVTLSLLGNDPSSFCHRTWQFFLLVSVIMHTQSVLDFAMRLALATGI